MPISKPHSTLGASNKGSCIKLAFYLEKENQELDELAKNANSFEKQMEIESRKQFFFSHSRSNISTNEVIDSIDSNIKKLGKTDAKFFGPTISFSENELNYIVWLATKRKNITSIWQLTNSEYEKYNNLIKEYIRIVMSNYAKNFNRQEKGLKSGNDLVYFAKIEHFRKFKGTDKEVLNGNYKTGEFKPGLNSHCHVIVSRKDKTQRLKLTPTTKERLKDRTIGNNKYRVGFDRMNWINQNEFSFDAFFKYKRKELEKFKTQHILKNGSPEEKEKLLIAIKEKETQLIKTSIKNEQKTSNHKLQRRHRKI